MGKYHCLPLASKAKINVRTERSVRMLVLRPGRCEPKLACSDSGLPPLFLSDSAFTLFSIFWFSTFCGIKSFCFWIISDLLLLRREDSGITFLRLKSTFFEFFSKSLLLLLLNLWHNETIFRQRFQRRLAWYFLKLSKLTVKISFLILISSGPA